MRTTAPAQQLASPAPAASNVNTCPDVCSPLVWTPECSWTDLQHQPVCTKLQLPARDCYLGWCLQEVETEAATAATQPRSANGIKEDRPSAGTRQDETTAEVQAGRTSDEKALLGSSRDAVHAAQAALGAAREVTASWLTCPQRDDSCSVKQVACVVWTALQTDRYVTVVAHSIRGALSAVAQQWF